MDSKIALSVQRKYHLDAAQMYRASGIIERNEIFSCPSGSFIIKSQSRLGLSHHVNPQYEECTCEASRYGVVCIHLAAWLLWRAWKFQQAKDEAITAREKRVALVEKFRPRTEWVEELDLA